MKSKSLCNREQPRQAIKLQALRLFILAALFVSVCVPRALAGSDAPQWMHVLMNAPLPAHDEKTDAVLLYAERNVTVLSVDKIRTQVRKAYKILRPSGRQYGQVFVRFSARDEKVTSLHGWCIPATGKDYEVKDKEAVELAVPKIEGAELVSDVRAKAIRIPASEPGNIVGYEYEIEEQPLVLQDQWDLQEESPVRESHYSLQLPAGWEYKAFWLNYPEVKPTSGSAAWQWAVSDVKGVREEEEMPPMQGVVGQMIVSFLPPGGVEGKGFSNWQQMGTWYWNLANGRRDASPEIKQEVAALTSAISDPLDKMRAIAQFVQHDIRYVAIELGIGGFQPHAAPEIFAHRYGDCKDKATLMSSMLREIGVDSYYLVINSERGTVTRDTPAYNAFDHVILAIKLPTGLSDKALVADPATSPAG